MKIAVSSDWHCDWTTSGVLRFDDVRKAAHETVDAARDHKVDAYMFLGDLQDPDSGARVFHGVALSLAIAKRLSDLGIPSFWIPGNHDVIEDGTGASTLTPLEAADIRGCHVMWYPEVLPLLSASVIALPFTPTSHRYDPIAEFEALRSKAIPDAPLIVIGHLQLEGIIPGEETIDMPRGRDVFFPVDTVRPHAALMMNGHYHRQQRHNGVHIPGALQRLTHGEETHQPGYLIVEL